jgi:hypothetical protein
MKIINFPGWWQTVLADKLMWNDRHLKFPAPHLSGGGWYLDLPSGRIPPDELDLFAECKEQVESQQRAGLQVDQLTSPPPSKSSKQPQPSKKWRKSRLNLVEAKNDGHTSFMAKTPSSILRPNANFQKSQARPEISHVHIALVPAPGVPPAFVPSIGLLNCDWYDCNKSLLELHKLILWMKEVLVDSVSEICGKQS